MISLTVLRSAECFQMSDDSTLWLGRAMFESLVCNTNTQSLIGSHMSNGYVISARVQHWPSGLSATINCAVVSSSLYGV